LEFFVPVNRGVLAAGALLGASGVMLGAFGAHALRSALTPQAAGWWQTGVQYQMWHALALLLTAALPLRRVKLASLCFGLGALIFSGSLYLMALGLPRWLGAVTPIGGLALIAGWLVLGWSALGERGGR
jgi:uncharacterized membrane protein YgdD (TMEM256/DUF423 family)